MTSSHANQRQRIKRISSKGTFEQIHRFALGRKIGPVHRVAALEIYLECLGIDPVPFADFALLLRRKFQSDGLSNGPDHVLLNQTSLFDTPIQRLRPDVESGGSVD